MGHACSSGCSNYFGKLTSDQTVQYTGPAVPALGICTNDYLSEVEAVILQKLIDYSTGIGISIPSIDLTTCAAFTGCITCCGTCTDLPCLLECYKNAICTIFGEVTTLQSEVTALLNGPYNIGCLQNLPANPTLNQIVQEIILEFCALQTALNALSSTVSGFTSGIDTTIGNFLLSAISSCTGTGNVVKSGTGSSASISFKGFVPVGAILPYGGATTGRFDATGLGLAGTDMCGFAIANGANGTINMGGQVPVGLTNMGGALPGNAAGLSLTTTGTQLGETDHILITNEIPSMAVTGTITVNDPGHSHLVSMGAGSAAGGNTTNWAKWDGTGITSTLDGAPDLGNVHYKIRTNTTGITVTTGALHTGGSGFSHNNMQPSTGVLYIQRVS